MGISLHDRAVSDSQKIHNNNLGGGGFSVDVKFTNRATTPESQTILALYNDVSDVVFPENGTAPIVGAKISISFHQSDLTIWDGLADIQRWNVEFVNGAGQSIKAEIKHILPDRSFGDIVVICTICSGHMPTT